MVAGDGLGMLVFRTPAGVSSGREWYWGPQVGWSSSPKAKFMVLAVAAVGWTLDPQLAITAVGSTCGRMNGLVSIP